MRSEGSGLFNEKAENLVPTRDKIKVLGEGYFLYFRLAWGIVRKGGTVRRSKRTVSRERMKTAERRRGRKNNTRL